MSASANIVELAALIGDTARSTMLAALVEGQMLTGGELADIAGITKSTASEHLRKLTEANLVACLPSGRFRYYHIGSPRVAAMLECMGTVAVMDLPPRFEPKSARGRGLSVVRMCYDHLAGSLAVALATSLQQHGHIALDDDGGAVTPKGLEFLEGLGIRLAPDRQGRIFCKPCLDWTERQYHLGGKLGAALACHCQERGWVRRVASTRKVEVSPAGTQGLRATFSIDVTIPAIVFD